MTFLKDSPKPSPARIDYRFWLAVLIVMVIAAGIRLYNLGGYPQLFNQDEAVLGYDAYSLWKTGHDQHGELLPVFFRTFGDYVPPVSNYIDAPFVGLLGLSETTTRLPFALMGIGAVFLVALLGRRWFGAAAGVLAALFLAIDPWQIYYSRIAFPNGGVPFFIAAALYSFTRAMSRLQNSPPPESRRAVWLWLTVSGGCFGLLTGTYPTLKLEAPLLFGACLLAAAPLFWRNRWLAAYWIFIYLFFVSPLAVRQILDWNQIQTRYNMVSGFGRPDWSRQALRLYAEHYDPGSLFFEGFRGSVTSFPTGVGELFWPEGILWVAAVVGFSRQGRSRRLGFSLVLVLTLWFFTYPIADSLTEGDEGKQTQLGRPHELRAYNFLPLPELLAGYGAVVVWELGRRRLARNRWQRLAFSTVLVVVGGVLLISFNATFLPFLFRRSAIDSPPDLGLTTYHIGLGPLLDQVSREASACDQIWMEGTNQTYIYYLFFARYPPDRYQQFALNHVGLFNSQVSQIYNVRFGSPDLDPFQSTPPICPGKPYRVFYLEHDGGVPNGWQSWAAFKNNEGVPIWQVLLGPALLVI